MKARSTIYQRMATFHAKLKKSSSRFLTIALSLVVAGGLVIATQIQAAPKKKAQPNKVAQQQQKKKAANNKAATAKKNSNKNNKGKRSKDKVTQRRDGTIKLPCMQPWVEKVRANSAATPAAFKACQGDLKRALQASGMSDSVESQRVVFATAMSNRFAPYGSSTEQTWDELRKAPTLQCGTYALLTEQLYRFAGGKGPVMFINWSANNGPLGSHAQLMINGLLADPTVGLVAPGPLSEIVAGRKTTKMVDTGSWRYPPHWYDFEDWVKKALRQGQLRADQLAGQWVNYAPAPAASAQAAVSRQGWNADSLAAGKPIRK